MVNLEQIKTFCRQYHIVPAKSRGQNFLLDRNIIQKIVAAANLSPADTVLEVGPGLGGLTDFLAKRAGQVIAVELDKKIILFLQAKLADWANVRLIEADILKLNLSQWGLSNFGYKVVANLPYNITAKFLRNFLANSPKPQEMILMVQKEVAQRLTASPGQLSVLGLAAQFYGQPEILFAVGKNCFWPKPAVDSAVIKITINRELPQIEEKLFFRTVKIGFSAKRKQLHNNLAAGFDLSDQAVKKLLSDLGLDEKIRAQDLSLDDWLKLAGKLAGKFKI
ncbi:MAG TPA: 16S rRNA (adenine(1518)-N(6)/adenine(1519)-N(6))-dimethyltransferase RsmA [bacterium]|nr:16S rRNA (adenine(1518)-N(6)/adenine(1519)-N(6))-dimethyltransferase RsmA [bacterium]HNS34159.1 16S rRNA (adenine(1518)-N(6)/adenine(1519)-N(6))-dimethyltransferase RsmA [bacterium]HQA64109.1 16S rRNA (adenine(1518)-N(6)/adenine(1519)-N(6))-dimethyltransferase RsmA [bacterium]